MGGAAAPIAIIAASVITGAISAHSTKKAQQRGAKLAEKQIDLEQQERERQQQRLQPFTETGTRALGTLTGELTPFQQAAPGQDPSTVGLRTFQDDDLFRFQQEQGERAITRLNAARGFALSGSSANALLDFNRQLSGEAAQRERARLFDIASLGQNSALGQANISANSLRNQADITSRQIGTQASLDLGRTQAITGAVGGVAQGVALGSRAPKGKTAPFDFSSTPVFDEIEREREARRTV